MGSWDKLGEDGQWLIDELTSAGGIVAGIEINLFDPSGPEEDVSYSIRVTFPKPWEDAAWLEFWTNGSDCSFKVCEDPGHNTEDEAYFNDEQLLICHLLTLHCDDVCSTLQDKGIPIYWQETGQLVSDAPWAKQKE